MNDDYLSIHIAKPFQKALWLELILQSNLEIFSHSRYNSLYSS